MSTAVVITASDINKLRQATGAGMMDCRKALTETNGDFEAAIDWLRKQGQKVAAKRSDREAKEGVVIAQTNAAGTIGYAITISSETDFVSRNDGFKTLIRCLSLSVKKISVGLRFNLCAFLYAQPISLSIEMIWSSTVFCSLNIFLFLVSPTSGRFETSPTF